MCVCAVVDLQAVGEPPFHLGAAVFFALKDAVYAARAEAGLTGGCCFELQFSTASVVIHVHKPQQTAHVPAACPSTARLAAIWGC